MSIIIRKAERGDIPQIAKIITNSFGEDLQNICKDMDKVSSGFESWIDYSKIFVADENNKIIAIAAISGKKGRTVAVNRKQARKLFGFQRGRMFKRTAKKEFEKQQVKDDFTGYIDIVSVDPKSQGKGLASKMLTHAFQFTPYKRYWLDTRDNNPSAYKAYMTLGFREFKRQDVPKRYGFKQKVFMEIMPKK